MKVEMGKKYRTRAGDNVTILKTDLKSGVYTVCAVIHKNESDLVMLFRADGMETNNDKSSYDLIEVGPYEDFKIDDKVLVWDDELTNGKARCHFAGVSASGKPMTYPAGKTSFTYNNKYDVLTMWNYCEKADET